MYFLSYIAQVEEFVPTSLCCHPLFKLPHYRYRKTPRWVFFLFIVQWKQSEPFIELHLSETNKKIFSEVSIMSIYPSTITWTAPRGQDGRSAKKYTGRSGKFTHFPGIPDGHYAPGLREHGQENLPWKYCMQKSKCTVFQIQYCTYGMY